MVYELTIPSSQRTSSMTKMVQSIEFSLPGKDLAIQSPSHEYKWTQTGRLARCGKISLGYAHSVRCLLVTGSVDRRKPVHDHGGDAKLSLCRPPAGRPRQRRRA